VLVRMNEEEHALLEKSASALGWTQAAVMRYGLQMMAHAVMPLEVPEPLPPLPQKSSRERALILAHVRAAKAR
jgi:hypothetical protein